MFVLRVAKEDVGDRGHEAEVTRDTGGIMFRAGRRTSNVGTSRAAEREEGNGERSIFSVFDVENVGNRCGGLRRSRRRRSRRHRR